MALPTFLTYSLRCLGFLGAFAATLVLAGLYPNFPVSGCLAALGLGLITVAILGANSPNPLLALPFLILLSLSLLRYSAQLFPFELIAFGAITLLCFWAQLNFLFRASSH